MEIKEIVEYLNSRFSQDSPEYSIFMGAKPQVIRLDEETAISLWACGAIVCRGSMLFFISEDDGNWFAAEYVDKDDIGDHFELHPDWFIQEGMQGCFNIGWADSFIRAMQSLKDYVWENGEPVYFSGTTTICNYELKAKS